MGMQGIPMKSEERKEIIDMHIAGILLYEIMEKTAFSQTAIVDTIENYEREQIDAKGYYKDLSIRVKDGKFIKMINPVEFVEKD